MFASELLKGIHGMQASPERDARIVRAALDGGLVVWPWCQVPLPGGRGYFEAQADYVSIGEGHDWVRVPLGGAGYQMIADAVGAVLPSAYMVELTWQAAPVKLQPQPFKDLANMMGTERFYEHHALIEKQRAQRGGLTPQELVAGQKKDLVVSNKLAEFPGAVCIFGWDSPDGKVIQPVSTRHKEFWYSDYSHGGRLVRKEMVLDGQRVLVEDVLRDPARASVLTGGTAFAVKSQGPDEVLRVTRYTIPDQLRALVGRVSSSSLFGTAAAAAAAASSAAARPLGERAADVCLAELRAGVAETPPGSGTSPRIREYFAPGRRRDTNQLLHLTAGDWCAAAQCWAATAAAQPGEAIPHGYRVSVLELTQDAQAGGAWRPAEDLRAGRYQLRRGDLVCFKRPSAQAWTGHVVRVDAPPDASGTFWGLSANNGNAWGRVSYSLNDANLTGAIAYPGGPAAAAAAQAPVVRPASPPAAWDWAPARPEPRGLPTNTILAVPGVENLSEGARRMLLDLCDELGMPVDSLVSVMASESGLKPWIINGVQRDKDGRGVRRDGKYVLSSANQKRVAAGKAPFFAVGLNQLTLGAKLPGFDTNDKLLEAADWSAEEQIQRIVRPFYQRMGGSVRGASPGKVYMLNFLPKYATEAPSFVIGDRDSQDSYTRAVYQQNQGFDRDGDGKITVGDVHQTVAAQVRASGGKRLQVSAGAPAAAPSPPASPPPATVPASVVQDAPPAPPAPSQGDRAWFVQSPGARALVRSTAARRPRQGTQALVASVRPRQAPTPVIANPSTATGWGSADDMRAYISALKAAVDGLMGLVMGDVMHGTMSWKTQFNNWVSLFCSWWEEHHDDWFSRDETWQTATSFHMRYLEWRKAAKEQGFNTASLGPDPDPDKAKELEEQLKSGGSEWGGTVKAALAATTGVGVLFGVGYVIAAAKGGRR